MELLRLNPFRLRITDPLSTLQERRQAILTDFESGTVLPVFVIPNEFLLPNEREYFVFNGNKRTVIARELVRSIRAYIISTTEELKVAQEQDPRFKLPLNLPLNYEVVMEHLYNRAQKFSKLDYQSAPIPFSEGLRRIRC